MNAGWMLLARQGFLEADDFGTLRALGMSLPGESAARSVPATILRSE